MIRKYVARVQMCLVHKAHSQHVKHARARGSGGMPPRNFLKDTCYEIASKTISFIFILVFQGG